MNEGDNEDKSEEDDDYKNVTEDEEEQGERRRSRGGQVGDSCTSTDLAVLNDLPLFTTQ